MTDSVIKLNYMLFAYIDDVKFFNQVDPQT